MRFFLAYELHMFGPDGGKMWPIGVTASRATGTIQRTGSG